MRNVLHVVKQGDTLWDLSAKFIGDPFEWHRLYAYNNRSSVKRITGRGIKDPDLIYVGQKLLIQTLSGSKEAVQEGLKWGFFTGAALLIGTIVSDFLSGGLGLADDWVTVPLALSMMGVSIAADKLPAQAPIQIY